MMLYKKQIQAIFLFEFKMSHKTVETLHNINNTFGPGTANNVQCNGGSRSFERKQEPWIWGTQWPASSVTQSCPTLCDPMDHGTSGLPAYHQLPEFTQTHVHRVSDAIQPSHPLSSPSLPFCSWGSQGKNTEVVCHSLLQWTTFCQISPPWPARLGFPHGHGLVSLS